MNEKLRRKLQGRRAKQRKPAARKLSQQIADFGASHALKPDETARLELSRISKEEASRELKCKAPADGFKIPCFGIDGERTGGFRIRFDDYASFTDPIRYLAPKGRDVEPYFPPLTDWEEVNKDTSIRVAITEGDLKAAACTARIMPCIGIPGISCWHGTKHELALLPGLKNFKWEGRTVKVIPDSDVASNPNVRREAYGLAAALSDAGAVPSVVHIPCEPDGKKVGVDDFLLKHSPEELRSLNDNAPECNYSHTLRELSRKYTYVRCPSMIAEDTPHDVKLHDPRVFVNELEAPLRATTIGANGKPRLVSAAKLWMESPSRPAVEQLVYKPGQTHITDAGELNLWHNSSVVPCKGDTRLWEKLLAHLLPDAAEREYVECWFAAPLQKLGLKLMVAVVLWGRHEGTGKTMLGTTIGLLHGSSNYAEIGQAELDSTFNEWQTGKTFIQGSEVCGEKDSRIVADKLKTIITGDKILVNKKFQPIYTLDNCANFYFTSNHPTAVFVGEHARRFAIFEVRSGPLPAEFYGEFVRWRDTGGLSAILYRLQNKDLRAFNPKGHAPKTAAREAMIEAHRTQVQSWCHELRNNTDTALTKHGAVSTTPGSLFTVEELLGIFDPREQSRLTEKGMAMALREAGFTPANNGDRVRIPNTDWRLRLWVIREALRIANMNPGQIGAIYAEQPEVKARIKMAAKNYVVGR